MIDQATLDDAADVLARLRARGMQLALAESCTGGLIAAALTHVAGSSDVVDRGFVTYSNAAKTSLLGVPPELILEHGAVSGAVALAMASGALDRSMADVTVSVTGVAGPGGGSEQKPVGTVWFGLAARHGPARAEHMLFPGDRASVRRASVLHAFGMLRQTACASGAIQRPV